MKIRDVKKSDYAEVDRILLQLHKVHVKGRPELFLDKENAVIQDNFDSIIENDEIIYVLRNMTKEKEQ